MPPGVYHVVAEHGAAKSSADVRVKAGEITEATIVMDGGELRLTAVAAKGEEPIGDKVEFSVYEGEEGDNENPKRVGHSYDPHPLFFLPDGDYHVAVKHKAAKIVKDLEVDAGERNEVTISMDGGGCFIDSMLMKLNP